MADSTGFFGGLSGGLSEQQAANLAQQKQVAVDKQNAQVQAQKQIDATIQHIQDVAKAAAANGNDPKKILAAVQPLIQSAQGIAQAAGLDPARVAQTAQLVTMQPVAPADKKHSVVKIGSDINGDKYGVLEQNSGTVTPIPGSAPVVPGQPALTPSDTLSPGQVQRANPPPAAPVSQVAAPVQQSSAPAAPDGTPATQVAARFPSPDQGTQTAPTQPAGPTFPPNMQPGPEAVDYAINNNIVGPEFLKALPPTVRNTVQDVASYKIPLESASIRKDGRTKLASLVHQYTNGEYDSKYYKPMQAALKEFTSGGQTSPAGMITAGNTAIAHGAQVADAIDKLSAVPGLLDKIAKSNTPLVSYAANALKNQAIRGTSEGQALSAFQTAANHFVDETTKFYAGGQPAEAGRERGLDSFNAAKSPAELYQALNSESELLSGKVNALQDRWKTAMSGPKMGDTLIRNAIPDFPILSEASKTALDRIGQGYLSTKFKGQANPGVVDFKTYFGGQ